jgi:hypothetical protein
MTTIAQLASVAAPINDELAAHRARIESALAGRSMEEAQAIIQRVMPQIKEIMERAAQAATTAAQIIAEWLRQIMPAFNAMGASPLHLYEHGTPHQRHIAWRKLKRAGWQLPNSALRQVR